MPAQIPLYKPVLKKGVTWYIEYYHEVQGARRRIRRSKDAEGLDLNSIVDLAEREVVAKRMMEEIRSKVAPRDSSPDQVLFLQALQIVVELKRSDKFRTNKSFSENARWLSEYFQSQGWGGLRCALVTFDHIQAYFDYLLLKKGRVTNSTFNSRRNNLRSLFSELVTRKYLPENYVKQIKPRPKSDPIRRPLTADEVEVLVQYLRRDRALWLAYLLLGWLAIRPGEIRELRVGSARVRTAGSGGADGRGRNEGGHNLQCGLLNC